MRISNRQERSKELLPDISPVFWDLSHCVRRDIEARAFAVKVSLTRISILEDEGPVSEETYVAVREPASSVSCTLRPTFAIVYDPYLKIAVVVVIAKR